MSTNESLVLEIQAGNTEKMTDLWEQMERLAWWAVRRARMPFWMTPEDLHQLGFIVLAAAVVSYKPEEGAFSSWFMLHLKRTFADACGRTKRQLFDPVNLAIPLDKPVGEDEKTTLAELIEDKAAESMISAVEERDEQEQRREAVRVAVAGLPALERSVLGLRYFQDMSVSATARTLGISEKEARKRESNALRYLRHPDRSRKLREVWR